MNDYKVLVDGLQLIITIGLGLLIFRLNTRVSRLNRKYDQKVERLQRMRELLTKLVYLMSMTYVELGSDSDDKDIVKFYIEGLAVWADLIGTSRVVGGAVLEKVGKVQFNEILFHSVDEEEQRKKELDQVTWRSRIKAQIEVFRRVSIDIFEVIDRQIEKEIESL